MINCAMSLPTRERGLKYAICVSQINQKPSLPTRERGLKLFELERTKLLPVVAPHAGAWIEIYEQDYYGLNCSGRSPRGSVD